MKNMLQYLKKLFDYVLYSVPFAVAREMMEEIFEEHRAAPRRRRLKKAGRRSRRHKK
jgi:hypothetical protein